MQSKLLKILALGLLLNIAAYGQSLGDIARENREKQAAEEASGAKPRMITNKDLPPDPPGTPAHHDPEPPASPMANNRPPDYRSVEPRAAEQRAGEQWKRQIEEQRNRVANLQARMDRINAAMRAVGGTVQYDQPHSRYEARQMERVAEMQQLLDEQKRKLDAMQEAARRAGMHTSVYDP
jgi:hypothetical protein